MPISVMIEFPIDVTVNDALLADRPELMRPIGEIIRRHGFLGHQRLVGDGRFIDIDSFQSIEHYHAFKTEAQAAIDAYEDALGVRSTDTVWHLVEDEV